MGLMKGLIRKSDRIIIKIKHDSADNKHKKRRNTCGNSKATGKKRE